jgi:hypothetical protein
MRALPEQRVELELGEPEQAVASEKG